MSTLRIAQVITRCVRGGAYQVVRALLDRLPRAGFEQTLIAGPEAAPAGALVVPELVREIDPLRDAAALIRMTRIFAKERPDVVHAHDWQGGRVPRQCHSQDRSQSEVEHHRPAE